MAAIRRSDGSVQSHIRVFKCSTNHFFDRWHIFNWNFVPIQNPFRFCWLLSPYIFWCYFVLFLLPQLSREVLNWLVSIDSFNLKSCLLTKKLRLRSLASLVIDMRLIQGAWWFLIQICRHVVANNSSGPKLQRIQVRGWRCHLSSSWPSRGS